MKRLLCSSVKFRCWKIFTKSLETGQFWTIKGAWFKIPTALGWNFIFNFYIKIFRTPNFDAKFSTPNFLWTLISAKFNLQSRHWTLNRNRGFRGFSGSKAVMAMPVRSVRSHLVQTDPKKQNFSPELILRSIKIRPRSKIVFYYVLSQIPVQKSSLLIGYENPTQF